MKASNEHLDRISDNDFPALFRVADKASLKAQRKHLWLVRIELVFLCLAVAFGAISASEDSLREELAITSSITIALGLVLSGIRRVKRPDREWYGARALAESVKTITWRYMTCAEPYEWHLESRQVDDIFVQAMRKMLRQREYLAWQLGGDLAGEPQITTKMRDVRRLDAESRKSAYLSDRIENQRSWYAQKAESNRSSESIWFGMIAVVEALALVSAILFVVWSDLPVNPVAILSGVALALLVWLQVKKHHELAQSYALAAHELGLIHESAQHVGTEEELSQFVSDSENAMSREQTLWLARRDVV